jgi:hypothetical protein
MKLVLTPQTLPDVESANVIGDIKGSEHPERVIVVSGHLIRGLVRAQSMMALASQSRWKWRIWSKLHLKPKRTNSRDCVDE